MIDDQERFWSKVDRGGPDECWEWTAVRHPSGYGKIKVNGKFEYAHRVAWALENNPPGDDFTLHKCDNPPCVNPAHLYLGDKSDNMRDLWERGDPPIPTPPETPSGTDNPAAKLNYNLAEEIRERYESESISQAELGQKYGVCQQTVGRVVRGEEWDADA